LEKRLIKLYNWSTLLKVALYLVIPGKLGEVKIPLSHLAKTTVSTSRPS